MTRIGIVTPAPPGSQHGNRITALRWARILRSLGHSVSVRQEYHSASADLLVALHARRSFDSIRRFRDRWPDRPILVVLTGTDVYGDLPTSPEAQTALEWATRLIALQPLAAEKLPSRLQPRLRVIYQSVPRRAPVSPDRSCFKVCVIGHLREVKDPFRAALAARLLPLDSRIRVVHLGKAMTPEFAVEANREMTVNPRYHWLGEKPRSDCLRELARSRLMVLSSLMEGGANVLSEALAASTPVLASRIAGSVGILGEDYPGYFPVQDTDALAALLHRAETDAAFYESLKERCDALADLVAPEREQQTWKSLLEELAIHAEAPKTGRRSGA